MQTIRQAVVAGGLGGVALCLALPMGAAADRQDDQADSNTRVRGIHQSLFIYAQSNRDWFPGMTSRGVVTALGTNVGVHWLMIENDFFTPDYPISPRESIEPWAWPEDDKKPVALVTAAHLSYATVKLDPVGTAAADLSPRNQTWKGDLDTGVVVVTDRNTSAPATPASVWSDDDAPGWNGSVCWADNHVTFEDGPVFESGLVRRATVEEDGLFTSETQDVSDFLMTFALDGNGNERAVARRE